MRPTGASEREVNKLEGSGGQNVTEEVVVTDADLVSVFDRCSSNVYYI